MAAYCAASDVDTGNIPWPRQYAPGDAGKLQAAESAAKEIDAKLGIAFQLPLTKAGPNSPDQRILSYINKCLAIGRVVVGAASAAETSSLHSYGYYMIKEAQKLLDQIIDGEIRFDSARIERDEDDGKWTGPLVTNAEPASYVDSFYGSTGSNNPHGIGDGGYLQGVPRSGELW